MAEKKFFVDINLQGSALTNAKIGTNSAIGSTEGAFGYDSASHRLQYFNGSATQNVANLSDISAVTGGLIFQGGYDPTTNTPDIADGSALKGFFWAATAAGTFLGESVQVGDSIVAKVDNAGATIADWLILQGNIVIATDSVDGISRLATQTEANDGTEGGAVVITPATLQGKIDAQITPEISSKLPLAGGTMSGNIDLDGNNIDKVQVLNVRELGSDYPAITLITPLNADGLTISDLPAPTDGGDAANKTYVDNGVANALNDANAYTDTGLATKLDLAGGTMTGAISMNNAHAITNLASPSADGDATNKEYVDSQDASKLNLAGGTMSGSINMGSNSITNATQVNAAQVNAGEVYTNYVLVNGGIETNSIGTENNTSPLSVRSNLDLLGAAGQMKIINSPAPTDGGDAANKTYVDTTAETAANTAIAASYFSETIATGDWTLSDGVYSKTITHNLGTYITFTAFYNGEVAEFKGAYADNTLTLTSNIEPTLNTVVNIIKAGSNL